jgi:predicted anti-sigma-YlaC factor YlaD
MKCNEIHNHILFFVEKQLKAEQLQAVELHLQTCSACRQLAEEISQTLDLIHLEKNNSSDDVFFEELMLQQNEKRVQSASTLFLAKSQKTLEVLKIAAVISFGIFMGVLIGNKLQSNQTDFAQSETEFVQELFNNTDLAYESVEEYLAENN